VKFKLFELERPQVLFKGWLSTLSCGLPWLASRRTSLVAQLLFNSIILP
jgi:hypothetical protein